MTEPVILAQFLAIAVIAVVSIALVFASFPNRENWPKAGWGAALGFEAARRAIALLAPDLIRDAPIPPDTAQFLVMCGFFAAAASGHKRHATVWVAAALAISMVGAITAAYRPDYAALFAPVALILAGLTLWRWWRATMMIAAIAVLGWGGLALAEKSGIYAVLDPTAMALTTGLLALVSGLAVFIDLIVPTHIPRVRSGGAGGTSRRRWGGVIGNGEHAPWPQRSNSAKDDRARDLQRRIEETEGLLETTMSSMSEGLVAIGGNSEVRLMNDALRRFLDLNDSENLLGKDFQAILLEVARRGDLGPGDPGSAADVFIARVWASAESQEPAFEWTLPDGRTCLVSSDPLPDGGIIATFTDVTEQRNTIRIMAQARDAAERGNKAKTEFLTRMSHELRTPLNAIIGFAGMLRDETLGPIGVEDYRVFATDIGTSGQTLLFQINGILDVARLEAGTLGLTETIIDTRAVLLSAISVAEATAAFREIGFSHYLVADLPAIRADEYRLSQIFGHLLDNALKFSSPGGQVMVRAMADPFEGTSIVVSDHGIGMTDEQVNSAFEPFAQADMALDRQFQGTGLGLSLVKGLVELHGGKITIASVPNQGTTVSVTLPPERIVAVL
jgi:signal transduction histidine kinase